ncbi:MAG: GxxExxY protein [Opitutales bacterium]
MNPPTSGTSNAPSFKLNHRDTEVTEKIIGAAIEVHRQLGPGLLESVYEAALAYELTQLGLAVERQKPVPIAYKTLSFDEGLRLDLLVAGEVIVELKCIDTILPIHEAQLLSYLKLTGLTVGLLINFKVSVLKQGIKRLVN